MRLGLLASILLLSFACPGSAPAYQPTHRQTASDPDALYAATVRVFLRRGFGFQNRDADARAVETRWMTVKELNLADDIAGEFGDSSGMVNGTLSVVRFRVIVNRNELEILTDCGKDINKGGDVDKDDRCAEGKRPQPVIDLERQLASEILNESASIPPGQRNGFGGYGQPNAGYGPLPNGGYAPPSNGNYGPPPNGGYPPPPNSGYAPPPNGGYAPPPNGGYAPPPNGGYAPPPNTGYGPPSVGPLGGTAPSGCTKDTDCKGDRVCERGACVSPPQH